MTLRFGTLLVAATTLCLSACDGVEEGTLEEDEATLDEDVGEAQQALGNCETGDNANAAIFVTSVGLSGSFQRLAQFINPTPTLNPGSNCGPTARRTTIVEATPSISNTHRYRFRVVADLGPTATSKTACEKMQLTTRLQRDVGGVPTDIGQWSENGTWTIFGCAPPQAQWEHTRLNKSGSTRETNLYTVRTFAVKANGTFGTVTVTANNLGT